MSSLINPRGKSEAVGSVVDLTKPQSALAHTAAAPAATQSLDFVEVLDYD